MSDHDPITTEEIEGIEEPGPTSLLTQKRPNAFTELMLSAKKPKSSTASTSGEAADKAGETSTLKRAIKKWDPRNGLGVYIDAPETNPEGRVVEYDDDFVVINDMYPKASVHLLLLPRSPTHTHQHPLHLLSSNPTLLTEIRTRCTRLKALAATELRRKYGASSTSDAPYQSALESLMSSETSPPPSSMTPEERNALLPKGRDWEQDVVVGVHTHPSMNHMHVHIFSRDMFSPCMKRKKHYLSFNSSFLVQLDEFPLAENSPRYNPGHWHSWDMKCWRCGKNFGNKFAALKEHLAVEFEEWKKE